MTPEEIKESIREFLYDLERTKTDNEIHNLILDYTIGSPPISRDWKKVDPKFKPAIKANELLRIWVNRG